MAEEWDIELGAKLKSNAASSLNKDIDNLVKSNRVKDIKIKIVPDDTELKKKISEIEKRIASINKQSINTNIGKNSTKQVSDINKAYKELLNTAKQINKTRVKFEGLDTTRNINEIKALESELDNLRKSFDKQKGAFNFSPEQLQTVQNELNGIDEKLNQIQKKKLDKIQLKFDDGGSAQKALDSMSQKFKKLGADNQEANDKLEKLRSLMNQIKTSDNIDDVERDYKNFQGTLRDLVEQYNTLSQAATASSQSQKNAVDASKLERDKAAFSLLIDNYIAKNQRAVEQFGGQLREVQAQIKVADNIELNNLKRQFTEIQARVKEAGLEGQTFGQKLSAQLEKLNVYFSASAMIMRTIQALRSMYQNVLLVDSAMTELYRVTDLSRQQYDTLFDNMTKSAKEYAVTLDTIINSTASWVRLGFDANTANKLAEITAMYQHVTDLDEKTAVDNLVTAYKGFEESLLNATNNDQAKAIESVADIYDKLGNEFAESAADVGDGLSKSASVLQQGGASIQEAAGMFTGIQEVLQDSSVSGAALKILTLRIRGMKGELQELGEEVDDNIDSVSKIQTQILNFTHGKVNIFDDNGNFRNIYDIMKDISAIYKDLSDTESAGLLEVIAGKNRANAVQALINNWSQVEKATKAAYEAEGTASQENQKYLDSAQGRLDTLKATWQSFSVSIMNSDSIKTGIKLVTDLVDILDKGVNTLGGIPVLLTTISGGLSLFKNVGRDKMFSLKNEYANINNSSA